MKPEQISNTRKKFLEWLEAEKQKGLKDIQFYLGNTSFSTIDDVLAECLEINEAVKAGRHSSLIGI